MESDPGFIAALEEAMLGADQGGMPVGAAIVSSKGQILGRGHNTRVQTGSAIFHAETAAFEDSKSCKASDYLGATLYTTLSPCDMCAGACLLYNIKRVVIGENSTMSGREPYLEERGVEVVVLNNVECKRLMESFIERRPDVWNAEPFAVKA